MRYLNTQDFLESQVALDLTKYPALSSQSHSTLMAVLVVCIEFGMNFDEIQKRLDEMTNKNSDELLRLTK
jgi:ABC-type enterochelin transport system permease subunit